MAPATPDLTGIIVTYESRELVAAALESLQVAALDAGRSIDVVVVDNASADGTAAMIEAAFPGTRVIANHENVGFGRANNQAFAVASGRWWVLLNPDARLESDALGPLLAALEADPTLAAAGPSIAGAGTEEAESAGMNPGLRSLAGHFLLLNRLLPDDRGGKWRGSQVRRRSSAGPRPVEWLSAAAMVVRPEAIRAVGGFEPSIFLYGEDMELGHQLAAAGWRLALVPGARASHSIGGSQRPTSTRWIDGIETYLERRHRTTPVIVLALTIIGAGLAVRAFAALLGGAPADHRVRMRASARHALARAVRRATGGGPSGT